MMQKMTAKSPISRPMRVLRSIGLAGFTGLMLALAPATPSVAQQASHMRISQAETGATQYVHVGLNKSLIVDLPANAAEVIVTSPDIAAAIMRSKRRAIIQGNTPGDTNILFLDSNGNRLSVLEVSVSLDSSGIESTIRRILPGSRVKVESHENRIVLSGTVLSGDDAAKAAQIAGQFGGGPDSVVSVINVAGPQQVALKVTVAEVSRETVKQLGINLDASFSAGGLSTGLINTPGIGGASNVISTNSVSAGVNLGNLAINATLRALERRGAVRTLAEPTLTTMSGEEAQFLAGGEFPVPVGVDQNVVTFEFKRFGVDLKFTPTVKSNGIIGLVVDTKVSEPTTEGGFAAGGITIPATKERQAKTSVQLQSGATLAIAGLIEDKVRQQFNALPGIEKLPILGALFRSRDFVHSQTELLILVTPVLASVGAPEQLPTDKLVFAGDAEAIFLGHMEKLYGVGNGVGSASLHGSVGFVLD